MNTLSTWSDVIWWIHVFSAWYMTGLIWFVQVVHYPLMRHVAGPGYAAFQHRHMRLTTWVVGPCMLLEALTGAALLYARPDGLSFAWALVNMAVLLGIWVSTAAWQVPCHHRLTQGFSARTHAALVYGNWVRTIGWTLRAVGLAVGAAQWG